MSLIKQAAQPHTLQPSHAAGCIACVRFPRARENSKPQHHRLGSSLNQVGNELLGAPATVDCFAPDLGEPWVHDDRDPHSIFASRPRTGECCSRVGPKEKPAKSLGSTHNVAAGCHAVESTLETSRQVTRSAISLPVV